MRKILTTKSDFGQFVKLYLLLFQNISNTPIKVLNLGRLVANPVPAIDILIDDGGHTMRQQIATFEELFPYVTANGVYLVEDLHTSYWDRWGGGYKRHGSFIEYSKNFIDQINACHSKQPRKFKVSDFTKTAKSLHFYDSVLVVEKHPMVPPSHARTGHAQFPDYDQPYIGLLQKLKRKLRRN